jgi:hypothetical protein
MKRSLYFLAVVSILSGIIVAPAAFAKSKKSTPPPQLGSVITSVTPTSVTVSEAKNTKTYTISQFTEVTVNGQKATIADLKPGMIVNVTLGGATQASRIAAHDAPHH